MLTAAFNIYQNMLENKLFEMESFTNQEHKVVLTGHSLGGGVATILGFFIRLHEIFKDRIYVYSFGQPGGLLNASAQKESKKFVVGVMYNDDVVPRLSMRSVFKLRNEIRTTLCECDQPKYKIIFWGFGSAILSCLLSCCKSRNQKVGCKFFR